MGNDETDQTTLTEKNIDKGSLNVFGLNHKISFRKVFLKMYCRSAINPKKI